MIYSPKDLSCYWNQSEHNPEQPGRHQGIKVGQNVIDYATGREMPADKLVVREVVDFKKDAPRRGALRIAKLMHAGDWNIAPQAVPNLMESLRKPPFSYDVVLTEKDLFPRDPNLIYYPLIYIHGRGALSFPKEDLEALRRHLEPGGGTLFADAACGSAAFDAAFRRFAAELVARPTARADPARRRALHQQDRVRPARLPVHQGGRRRQGLPSARGREAQRPLGDHLLEARPRLRPRAALGHRLQGLYATKAPCRSPATSSSTPRCRNRRRARLMSAPFGGPAGTEAGPFCTYSIEPT